MAKREIGTVLKIDGEAQFKSALSNINQELRVLSSEMGASMSAFDKNSTSMEALRTKSELYGKEIDAQKSKLEVLEQAIAAARAAQEKAAEAVRKATEEHGANSKEAQRAAEEYDKVTKKLSGYEIQANNTTKNINQLTAASRDNNAEMGKLSNAKLDKLIKDIKNVASEAGKAAKEVAKISADIVVGGIKKGTAAFAAYASAITVAATALTGLTANAAGFADDINTMSKVTGISTDQLQIMSMYSAQIDVSAETTANALKKLTKTMGDAAGGSSSAMDKFDKLGISITDMNGNLRSNDEVFAEALEKLGNIENETERDAAAMDLFGKSATELNPLILGGADALKEFGEKAKENGLVLSQDALDGLNAFNDSIDNLKTNTSAAGNILAGVFATQFQKFTDTIGNSSAGIIKDIADIFSGDAVDGSALTGKLTALSTEMTENINSMLPTFLNGINTVILSVIDSAAAVLPDAVNTILPVALQSFTGLVSGIVAAVPDLVPTVLDGAVILFTGIIDGLNSIIEQITPMLPEMVTEITGIIIENAPGLVSGAVQLFTGIVNALTEATPSIMQAVTELIPVICDTVIENIPLIIQAGLQLFTALVGALPDIIIGITAAVPDIVDGVVMALSDNIPLIIETGITVFTALVRSLPEIIAGIVAIIPEIITSFVNGFENYAGNIADIGKNIIAGIGDGIINGVTSVKDKINSAGEKIMQSFKDFFGIASPSKLMKEQVGFNLADGLAIGFTDQMGKNSVKMAAAVPKDYSIGIVVTDEKTAKKAIDTITADYKKSRLTAEQADTALLEVYKACEEQKISVAAYANEKITAARKDAADEDLKTLTKTIESEIKAYQKQIQDIEKEIQNTADSLSESYKSMYTFETDKDGNILSAKTTDKMKNATAELENYYAELEKLSGRNISETMVKQLSEMSVEEGTAVAAYWNSLSDEKLNAVSKNWEKYQDSALKVSEWFHADEMEQAASDMINAMSTTISENREALDEIGAQLAAGIKAGMTGEKANASIREMCDNIVKQIKDYFGIASPSKLMKEQVGFNLADGISGGFIDRMKQASADMNAAVPTSFGLDADFGTSATYRKSSDAQAPSRGINFTQINNSPKALDAASINRQTRRGLQLAMVMR